MKPHIFSKTFRIVHVCVAVLLVTSCLSPATQAATFNSYAAAVSGSYFLTQQPFVWVGNQPPDEADRVRKETRHLPETRPRTTDDEEEADEGEPGEDEAGRHPEQDVPQHGL